LSQPLFVGHADDDSGRLFVLERAGRIRIISAAGSLLATPFLDIASLVGDSGSEQGLLGLAFHPSYETNGWMDLRDWSDWVTARGYQITLGPGRRGCGANLFIMIDDPEGYRVEWSAEIEQIERDMAARTWPHAERSLNRWGRAHLRS